MAALSIPKYKERPESVYFFKRGMCYIIDITQLSRIDLPGKFYWIFSLTTENGVMFTVKRHL